MTNIPRLSTCLFLLSFLLITACSSPEKEKEAHYQKALEYTKTENTTAAIIELRNAVALDAKFARAHYQLGLLYIKENNAEEAFKSLQRAVSLNPDNLDATAKLAEFYLISKKNDECQRYVDQILSRQPDHLDGLTLLANLELINGNFDQAAAAVDKALANNPTSDKLYNIKGRIYTDLNQLDKAEEMFQKAVDYGPDNYANYRTLIIFYQRTDKPELMQALLTEMTRKFPENPQPHVALSSFYRKKNEFVQAETELKAALQTQPDDTQLHLLLLEFYKERHQYRTAESFLEGAIAKKPDSLDLKISLADLRFDMQKFDMARTTMESILQENELHGGANLLKAKFFLKEHKYEDAIAVLNPLINDYPKWAVPFYNLSLAHLGLGEISLAQKAIENALHNAPSSSPYHTLLAKLFLLQGEGNNGGREASIAIRLDSTNYKAAIILTRALVQVNKFKEAITVINNMLKKVPNQPELLGNLGLAYLGMDDTANSIKTFTQLMEITPDNSRVLSVLSSLSTKKDPQKGISLITSYIKKAPQAAGHQLLLGDLYARMGAYDKALRAFSKAQELDPDYPQTYVAIGRLMARQGKTEEAIAEYRQLLKTSSDSIPALMGIAVLLDTQGQEQEAISAYQRVLQIRPAFAPAANNLSWLLANSEDADLGEALRLAMLARKKLPSNADITDTLGWIHFKRKSYGLARSQFDHALTLSPNNPSILYHLALVQQAEQKVPKAIASLKKALKSSKPFKDKQKAKDLLNTLQ